MKNLLKKTTSITLFLLLMASNHSTLANDEVEYDYAPTFNDVTQEQGEFFGNVEYLAHIGVIEGYVDDTFGRKEYINRAEMMKLVVEGLGYNPDEQEYRNCFPDVRTAWYAKYVCFAEEEGWIDGYEDGFFYPANNVTKAQATKIIINAFFAEEVDQQNPEELANGANHFKDVYIVDWYRPYVALMNNKLLQSFNSNWFGPNFYVTRGNVADLFFRAMMVSEQDWEVYHRYFRDEFFKENDLEHLTVGQTSCYPFWPTFDAPYLWDYVSDQYGIDERPDRNADHYGSEGPDDFPYFDPGYFCPLNDGGMLFSNAITYDKQGAERHLMRFNSNGELLQDDAFECEEEKREPSIFYDNRDVVKAFKLESIDPETFTLIGCNHAKDKNNVYYGSAHSNPNYISSNIPNADPETFKSLGDFYGQDKNNAYYKSSKLKETDLETLEVLSQNHARDKDHVYYNWEILLNPLGESADPNTFEVLDHGYAKDVKAAYFNASALPRYSDVLEVDVATFEVLGENYARDEDTVFHRWDDLPDSADSQTFEVLNAEYAKDANFVYDGFSVIDGANSKTFELIGFNYGKDDQHVYYFDRIVEGANPATFEFAEEGLFGFARDNDQVFISGKSFEQEMLDRIERDKQWDSYDGFELKGFEAPNFRPIGSNKDYYTDGNHVYYHSATFHLMKEADPETFTVVEQYLPDPFARDKNHVYCETGIRSDDPENFDYAAEAGNCPYPPIPPTHF